MSYNTVRELIELQREVMATTYGLTKQLGYLSGMMHGMSAYMIDLLRDAGAITEAERNKAIADLEDTAKRGHKKGKSVTGYHRKLRAWLEGLRR